MNQQGMNSEERDQNEAKEITVSPKKRGMATAAFVLGIIGICLSFIPIINNAAFVLGILAAILGIVALVKKQGVGKAVTGVILGVLSIVITLVMQSMILNAVEDAFNEVDENLAYMAGDKTDDIMANFLDIQIGDFQVVEAEYWDESKVEVTIKNKSSEKASFNVTIEAVDSEENRIATDYIYVNDLGAGQSQKFEIFTLVTSDQYEALSQAVFRVVEASKY